MGYTIHLSKEVMKKITKFQEDYKKDKGIFIHKAQIVEYAINDMITKHSLKQR